MIKKYVSGVSFFWVSIFLFLLLTSQSPGQALIANGQPQLGRSTPSPSVVHLSASSIAVTISDEELPFKIEDIDRSFDAKQIIDFLIAFYDQSKAKLTNDIIVTSHTKRLVKGENSFNQAIAAISKKHKINVVYMPPPTGDDPNQLLRQFRVQEASNGSSLMHPKRVSVPEDVPFSTVVNLVDKDGKKTSKLVLACIEFEKGHYDGWQACLRFDGTAPRPKNRNTPSISPRADFHRFYNDGLLQGYIDCAQVIEKLLTQKPLNEVKELCVRHHRSRHPAPPSVPPRTGPPVKR